MGPGAALAGLTLLAAAAFASPHEWAERFANPPAGTRILKIIHGWPDQPQAQDALIAKLTNSDFGGVVCNVSFDQYLESDAKWQAFVRGVKAAKAAGMALWLYDERGYPSGNAGGLVLRDHPQWEARGLLAVNQECDAGPVALDLPPGRPVLTAAFPVHAGQLRSDQKRDLAAHVHNGRLQWTAPAGRWEVMAITESPLYEGTHAEGNLWQHIPYVNLLEPEPTARFLELTHARYARALGSDLGKYFAATFTDEPSLMSCFLRPMPYRPLPWAPNLPVEFRRRRGYALDANVLPALLVEAGPVGAKQRYDFWRTVGELVSENYFGQIRAWCRRHNLASGGHLLMEESPVAHVPLYGDFFRCARRFDAPGIDCLTSLPPEVPWYIARLLASAGELEGRTQVMCETSDHSQVWRPAGDTRPRRVVTEAEIRGTCNRLIVAGVNTINSYYSFGGLSDTRLRRLNAWVGRCGAAVRGGHQVADIALVYPVESIRSKFTPSRLWATEAAAALRIENLYRAAEESLFAAARDFTIVDGQALAQATVRGGVLRHGALRWRVVVLPGVDTLPLAAWENLARFVRQGGIVVALGARPANSEAAFPAPRVRALAQEMFGAPAPDPRAKVNAADGVGLYLPAGAEALLPLALNGALEPDVRVRPPTAPLRVTHRHLDGQEVFFLINDSPAAWAGQVSFAATGAGRVWDPATGQPRPLATPDDLTLELGGYRAAVVTFTHARPPQRRPWGSAALPNLVQRPVPLVEPTVPHGTYVEATLAPAPEVGPGPAWQATGRLTKGRVDTFLFAQFPFAVPLDLSQADCLVIDTWVPAGQRTPAQLLVILGETGGADFLANTGRSLAAPGYERCFVPLRQFQRAGWSGAGNGAPDLHHVRDLRVGWGGYLGSTRETVRFSVALPEWASLTSLTP